MKLTDLSIDRIREKIFDADRPVSAHALRQLERDPRQGVRKICELARKRFERERAERLRLQNMLNVERVLWRSGIRIIAGVDEAGVGPLAGPVVAAAVVFPPGTELAGVDDSKRLDPEQRARMETLIRDRATATAIGLADVGEIDRLNIYHASLLAMRRAVAALPLTPEHLLVDARVIPSLAVPQNSFYKGDGINFSIAAASIIAKTYRDRVMEELDQRYPGYGFGQHKGYSTPEHQNAIRTLGPCPVHRMSFAFIRELCGEFGELFYAFKEKLERLTAPDELREFEKTLLERWGELGEREQRKLKLMMSRRWKTL